MEEVYKDVEEAGRGKVYEHKVQYYETDMMGIVHHSNYIRWFEEARGFLLERAGIPYKMIEESGVVIPTISVSAQYKKMTKYDEIVCIQPEITSYNGLKLEVEYVIYDKKTREVKCTGTSGHCFIDTKGHPLILRKVNKELDERFRALTADGE